MGKFSQLENGNKRSLITYWVDNDSALNFASSVRIYISLVVFWQSDCSPVEALVFKKS